MIKRKIIIAVIIAAILPLNVSASDWGDTGVVIDRNWLERVSDTWEVLGGIYTYVTQADKPVRNDIKIEGLERNTYVGTVAVATPQGTFEVPYVPMSVSQNDLAIILENTRNQFLNYAEENNLIIADSNNYHWCFINQEFRPSSIKQSKAPVVGILSNGIPMIETDLMPNVWGIDRAQSGGDRYSAIEWLNAIESVIIKEIEVNGDIYTININPSDTMISMYRNGQRARDIMRTHGNEFNYSFIVTANEPTRVRILIFGVYNVVGNSVRTHCVPHLTGIDLAEMPVTHPQAPSITLQQLNIIQNLEQVMQEIRDISNNFAVSGGDVVIRVPIITSETLPSVSAEDFEAVQLAIYQSLKTMDLIMDGWEAALLLAREEIPRITISSESTIIVNPPETTPNTPIEYREGFWSRLLSFFINIFVPRTNFFQNEINILENRLHQRLPFQTLIEAIAQLQTVSGAMDGDADVLNVNFQYEGSNIQVDMGSRIKPYLQQARTLITGMYVILLAYYNYRQIYFLIRGTNYQSMSGGGGSG